MWYCRYCVHRSTRHYIWRYHMSMVNFTNCTPTTLFHIYSSYLCMFLILSSYGIYIIMSQLFVPFSKHIIKLMVVYLKLKAAISSSWKRVFRSRYIYFLYPQDNFTNVLKIVSNLDNSSLQKYHFSDLVCAFIPPGIYFISMPFTEIIQRKNFS